MWPAAFNFTQNLATSFYQLPIDTCSKYEAASGCTLRRFERSLCNDRDAKQAQGTIYNLVAYLSKTGLKSHISVKLSHVTVKCDNRAMTGSKVTPKRAIVDQTQLRYCSRSFQRTTIWSLQMVMISPFHLMNF